LAHLARIYRLSTRDTEKSQSERASIASETVKRPS
jgi:hypothetical protein